MCDVIEEEVYARKGQFNPDDFKCRKVVFDKFMETTGLKDIPLVRTYFRDAMKAMPIVFNQFGVAQKIQEITLNCIAQADEMYKDAKADADFAEKPSERAACRGNAIAAINTKVNTAKVLQQMIATQQKHDVDLERNEIFEEKNRALGQAKNEINVNLNLDDMDAKDKTKRIAELLWSNKGMVENEHKQIPIEVEEFHCEILDE